ncbi:MAG: hypothetical protein V7700_16425 [Halioglobus sp.]
MEVFKRIKGTATNKTRARVWLESAELALYGFPRGQRINIAFTDTEIIITVDPEGARKVAGRERNGRTICILDICFPTAQRDAMFKGAAMLSVYATPGELRISV